MHGCPGVVHDDLVRIYAAQCVRRRGPHFRGGGRQDLHGGVEGHGRQGDLNIELRFEGGSEDFEGLDSIDWYAPNGPECRGGGEDVVTYEKKLRWLQLFKGSSVVQ